MFYSSVSRCRSEGSEPTVGADELTALWDELRGLKDLVLNLRGEGVGQRQALRSVESRLRDGETTAERQRQNLDRLQVDVHDLRTVLSELRSGSRRREELEAQGQGQLIFQAGSLHPEGQTVSSVSRLKVKGQLNRTPQRDRPHSGLMSRVLSHSPVGPAVRTRVQNEQQWENCGEPEEEELRWVHQTVEAKLQQQLIRLYKLLCWAFCSSGGGAAVPADQTASEREHGGTAEEEERRSSSAVILDSNFSADFTRRLLWFKE